MGSRVRRFMRLQGPLLSNHHAVNVPPTWRVNIKDATITCNTKRNRIILELYANKLELFAESSSECTQWYEALTNAKSRATLSATANTGKENESARTSSEGDPAKLISLASEPSDQVDKRVSNLGKGFKVVKPQVRRSQAASSASSDECYEGDQPLVVQGQLYEETPASMIFKQFNFPAK